MIFEKIIKLIIFVFQYLNVMKKFYGNIDDKISHYFYIWNACTRKYLYRYVC